MDSKHAAPGRTPTLPVFASEEFARKVFRAPDYMRINARRLEHLATLGLPLNGRSVLEIGAGIGDLTTYFLDRGCSVTSVEPRMENCRIFAANMRERASTGYGGAMRCRLCRGDIDWIGRNLDETFDIVLGYGLLYHLEDPGAALEIIARRCGGVALIETCVSSGGGEAVNPVIEQAANPSQAFSGMGCRPTRLWLFNRLRALFPYVYVPRTQPAHDEFPLDWTQETYGPRTRAIFVASRTALDNPLLADALPDRQTAS